MKQNRTLQASMTVFLVLMLASVLTVVFSMLEAARVTSLRLFAEQNADQVMESVFAEYDKDIFSQYQLFCCGIGAEENRFTDVYEMAERVTAAAYGGGRNFFLGTGVTDVKANQYQLISDAGGTAFLLQAAECAADGLAKDVVKKAVEYVSDTTQKEAEGGSFTQIEENAVQAVKTIEEADREGGTESQKTQQPEKDSEAVKKQYGNPLDSVKSIKKKGILKLVLPSSQSVSEAAVDGDSLMTKRSIESGTVSTKEGISAAQKLLVVHYINSHFGTYREQGTQALAYEQEYLIGGKVTDKANLKAVANRLLLVREACNYVSLQQDSQKTSLAGSLASAICGATGTPILINAVQQGILLAWAYGESVLDVRTLLEGGKIAFIKNSSQWTLELEALKSLGDGWMTAKECENGLSYEHYLDLFLLMQSEKTTAKRSLALIECNIRTIKGREQFRIDRMMVMLNAEFSYEASPVFLQFVPQVFHKGGRYHYEESAEYCYQSLISDTFS